MQPETRGTVSKDREVPNWWMYVIDRQSKNTWKQSKGTTRLVKSKHVLPEAGNIYVKRCTKMNGKEMKRKENKTFSIMKVV